ncbi:MAG: hypothetical protein QXW00_02820 [Candidatus Woesearchaeota archaeon]
MQVEHFGNLSKKIILIGLIAILTGIAVVAWIFTTTPAFLFGIYAGFLWIMAVGIIIMAAYLDEISMELKGLYSQQTDELKLLRAEVGLLRHEMTSPEKKGKR